MDGILRGLRIVEGSAFIAAPLAGMTLAQMGADVIRFDQIGGGLDAHRWPVTADGTSIYWAGWNKGKRSIMIDLRSDEGRELAIALIVAPGKDSGIFLTNLPLRGGLAYEELCKRREDLIVLSIIGSPDDRNAVDYTANCAVGFPFVNSPADHDGPLNNPFPAWDVITGATAAAGLLAAERHRTRTGKGQLIRLALTDVAMATVANLGITPEIEINGIERTHVGNDIYGSYGRDFQTRDGRRAMVVAISPRQWRTLVEATGLKSSFDKLGQDHQADLADEHTRYQLRSEISAILEPWFRERSLEEISATLTEAGVSWGPYQTFSQMMAEDPRFSEANPMFQVLEQPGIGRYLAPGSPLSFGSQTQSTLRPAPVFGQHTDEILSAILGLPDYEIGKLHDRGVVAGPD